MNSTSFYQGLLHQLKQADDSALPDQELASPEPKPKRSLLNNPWLIAGLGGLAGLGGYGLYKHFNQPVQSVSDKINVNSKPDQANLLDNVQDTAYTVMGPAVKASLTAGVAGAALKKPWISRFLPTFAKAGPTLSTASQGLGRFTVGVNGISQAAEALNPNTHYTTTAGIGETPIKAIQLGGAATGSAIGLASKQTLVNQLARVGVASGLASGSAASLGARGAGMLIPGANIAVGAGIAGQLALDTGSAYADLHSEDLGVITRTLPDVISGLSSLDPDIKQRAISDANILLNTPEGKAAINGVTNPGFWTRLGYNPLGTGSRTELGGFQQAMKTLNDRYSAINSRPH